MPRISVVVPVYNVEEYLEACLDSIRAQTEADFEVLMVDDGSTDSSREIAQRYVDEDPRFRLLTQPNGGLSAARNTGADAAAGDFLSFVDSDDLLTERAYELMLESLEETGSDFATGNVHRLTTAGTNQAPFLARTFTKTRPKTHITKFRPLLADRIVPNKLWRTDFWRRHGFRFPEGRLHEDIPVVLPAQFLAKSVDIIADPVYYYRIRETGGLSITQRRLERKALMDRIAGIEHVSVFLSEHGPRRAKRWYDTSVVHDDLRYYLNVLELADDAYREAFLDVVNRFLDQVGRGAFKGLPAIERLKWHLVRARRMPELLEVLRFQREDLPDVAPIRIGRRWYGDYPYREDPALSIPRDVYRLDSELGINARVDELRWEGETLTLRGFGYITGIGAESEGSQKVTLTLLPAGRVDRLRSLLPNGGLFPRVAAAVAHIGAMRVRTVPEHRPDVTEIVRQPWRDVSWSGFAATIPARRLRRRTRTWDLYVTVRAQGVARRRIRFTADTPLPLRARDVTTAAGTLVRAFPRWSGSVGVSAQREWATVTAHGGADGEIELRGVLHAPGAAQLEVVRRDESVTHTLPLEVSGDAFRARVPLALLLERGRRKRGEPQPWELYLTGGRERVRVGMAADLAEGQWRSGALEVRLFRALQGNVLIVEGPPRPLVTEARWTPDGDLELAGRYLADPGEHEIALIARGYLERLPFPMRRDGERFSATLTPARMPSLDGPHPLREGTFEIVAGPAGVDDEDALAPVHLAPAVVDAPPRPLTAGRKTLTLGALRGERATVVASGVLEPGERGAYHQHRLQCDAYRARRSQPLRDAVVYTSFGGRQYSDNPRRIHEELVRRGAPLEHLWVLGDQTATVPDTARVVWMGSREYYEALASARYVVTNDHFPVWFHRRDGQVCLQTWHGTPLKRLGFDVSDERKQIRRFQHHWTEQVANWQYVLSPNAFTTPILRRAYRIEGEMLETGYPRNDVLAAADRDARSAALRERLGIPAGTRTVLYAPTFRDQVIDRRRRYRLDLHLDVERLRAAIGADSVLLFRKHHYIADAVPSTPDGFVRDVSTYPDATELLLAADVLVTDYSSLMFDYANTGRPMLFFTYDLDAYASEIRGFYFDFLARAPGPLLRTTDEVAEALRDLDRVRARYADRYAAFVRDFCELDDGGAAARAVDAVFTSGGR